LTVELGAACVEPHHSITHDLNGDTTEPSGIGRAAIIDRCDGEKTPSLVGISCLPSQTPQPIPVTV